MVGMDHIDKNHIIMILSYGSKNIVSKISIVEK